MKLLENYIKAVEELEKYFGIDDYFSFPGFLEFSHIKDIFSLGDIVVKELK